MTTDTEELPPRPRRRIVTPVTAGLTGVLLVAAGFIGGVEVQKGQQDGGGGGAAGGGAFAQALAARGLGGGGAAAAAPGGATQGAPGGGAGTGAGGASDATIGQVANKRGSTLYVTNSDGRPSA